MAELHATVFERPYGRQKDVACAVDARTAELAAKVLGQVENGRFTLEDCGEFVSACLEGMAEIDGEQQMDDLHIHLYDVLTTPKLPWADFVSECARAVGVKS